MNAPLRVGLLVPHNPYDKNSFSGTGHYLYKGLRDHPDITLSVLGNYRPLRKGVLGKLESRFRKPRAIDTTRLELSELDYVVALGAGLVASLAGRQTPPILFVTDATPQFLRSFYGWELAPDAEEIERRALNTAHHVVYASHFMADQALQDFPDLAPENVSAFPFGLNLDEIPKGPAHKPPLSTLELLFIGRDWPRKGGDIALQTLDELLARGLKARLTVIGARPEAAVAHPHVEIHEHLNKNNPNEYSTFCKCLERAHVFLLPTRADCSSMVVAEVNAWGCPVLITKVGGIPSVMNEGANGRMLPLEADAQDWADAVCALVKDPVQYDALTASSIQHCQQHLTWSVWADNMIKIMHRLSHPT